jgi:hypothetical protein
MDIDIDLNLSVNINDLKKNLSNFSEKLKKTTHYSTTKNFNNSYNDDKNYKNDSDEFVSEYSENKFVQYSINYFIRLQEIYEALSLIATQKWKSHQVCRNIMDIKGKVK